MWMLFSDLHRVVGEVKEGEISNMNHAFVPLLPTKSEIQSNIEGLGVECLVDCGTVDSLVCWRLGTNEVVYLSHFCTPP